MPIENQLNNLDKYKFNLSGGIDCLEFTDKESDKHNIRLQLYDGGIHAHYFWENLAFDLESMKLANNKVAILVDHEPGKRAGYSTGAVKTDGKFVMTGRLLKNNADAQAIQQDAAEGFPFEASLRFDRHSAKIVRIAEGQQTQVNGRTLKGPGTVVYNANIVEGSVCTFGALKNCKSQVFNEDNEGILKMPLTIEAFKTDHADLHSQVFNQGKADGEKAERDLYKSIFKVCPDTELAVKCWQEDKSPADAEKAFMQKKIDTLSDENSKLKEAQNSPDKPADNAELAETEFSDDAEKLKDEEKKAAKPETFMDAADQYAKDHNCKLSEAIDKCVDLYPELHKAMRGDI